MKIFNLRWLGLFAATGLLSLGLDLSAPTSAQAQLAGGISGNSVYSSRQLDRMCWPWMDAFPCLADIKMSGDGLILAERFLDLSGSRQIVVSAGRGRLLDISSFVPGWGNRSELRGVNNRGQVLLKTDWNTLTLLTPAPQGGYTTQTVTDRSSVGVLAENGDVVFVDYRHVDSGSTPRLDRWRAGSISTINPLTDPLATTWYPFSPELYSVNALGSVAGSFGVFTPGQLIRRPGGRFKGLNDLNQILTCPEWEPRCTIFSANGTQTEVPVGLAPHFFYPTDFGNNGMLVGTKVATSQLAGEHAATQINGVVFDLNDLATPPVGHVFTQVREVAANGTLLVSLERPRVGSELRNPRWFVLLTPLRALQPSPEE